MKKCFALMIGLLAILATEAYAERLPIIGSDANNWGNVLNKYLLVSHTENGTLRQDLNGTFYNLNVSNNLAVIGNIYGELPDSFKLLNFTNAYDSRNDRFSNGNFTLRLSLASINTSQVNNLADFVISNEKNPSNSTIIIPSTQVTGLGALALSDSIKDSDINPTAGILLSKLAYGTSDQIIVVNSSGVPNYITLSGDAVLSSTGVLTVNRIGSGTTITKHISVAVGNVSTAEIDSRECGDLASVTISGASVGDTVVASPTAVSNGIETKNLIWNAYASSSDTVKIRACNPTTGDINILDTQTWRVDVWQH